MTMPFGEKAAVIGGRKAAQQVTVLTSGAPAASPTPGGDYLTRLLADALYAPVAHSHPWSQITSKPTTLGGYGITDAQPASAELTAITGLSAPGYVKRTGPGAYSVVASIPQADVAGGPFLPLAAGAANPLTGELYAAQGVRAGSNMLLRDLVGVAGFGAVYGTTNSPTDANYLLAFQADASEAYFNATSKIGLDINGNDMVLATSSGVDLAGTLTTDLSTGFVRSVGGTLSASALLASEIPDMDASKIVSGTLPDARIASAAVWNAKEPGITAGTTAQYWRGDKTWQTLNTTAVAEGTRLYYTDARARAAISGSAPISYSSSTGVISHLATDGNLHVPATSTTNNGRFLKAGSTAGSIAWASLTYSDLTGTVPTWNQNTTGSAAKWTTGRTVSATGDASWSVSLDGSANVSAALTLASIITAGGPIGSASVVPVVTWDAKGRLTAVSSAAITPAAIGALAAGGTAVNSSALGGVALDYFVRGNGAGPYGHRTTNVTSFNTLLPSGFYDNNNGISPLTTSWTHMIRSAYSDPASGSATWSFDIAANFFTPVNGHQEGYYVRVNEGSNWGTWRTLWHSGNLNPAAIGAAPAFTSSSAGQVWATPAASSGVPGLRMLVASDIPALNYAPPHSLGSRVVLRSNGSGGFAASQITDAGSGSITLANNAIFNALAGSQINLIFRNTTAAWTSFYAQATEAGFRDYNDDGSANSYPIYWTRGTGGLIRLSRPVNFLSNIQVGGTEIVTSSRAITNIQNLTISKAASDAIGVGSFLQLADAASGQTKGWALQLGASNTLDLWNYASSAWTKRASISSAGIPTFSGLAASTLRMATVDASGTLGATSWAYDGPWLSLANGGTVSGATAFSGGLSSGVAAMGTSSVSVSYAWFGYGSRATPTAGAEGFFHTNSGQIYVGAPTGKGVDFLVGGTTVASAVSTGFGVAGDLTASIEVRAPIIRTNRSLVFTGVGTAGAGSAPSGYSRVVLPDSGTTVLPTPSAGAFLIVQRTGTAPSAFYIKPAAGHTISYMDLGGTARVMTNSATSGLNVGAVGGSILLVGASSTAWAVIGAWPQGS